MKAKNLEKFKKFHVIKRDRICPVPAESRILLLPLTCPPYVFVDSKAHWAVDIEGQFATASK